MTAAPTVEAAAIPASASLRVAFRIVSSSGAVPRNSTWNGSPGRDPAIRSIDLNPLIVSDGVPVAVDALVELDA